MRLLLAAVATLAACSDDQQDAPAPAAQPTAAQVVREDGGGRAAVLGAGIGDGPLDEAGSSQPALPVRAPARRGRPIDITLRSTPPGAQVAVDGAVIGTTPAFWSGMADGREHEFVFTLPRHAIARYRFVPVSSGVIHGRLEPIREGAGAGTPAQLPQLAPPRPTPRPAVNPPTAPQAITNDAPLLPARAPIPGPVGPTPSAEPDDTPIGPMP